ncbi:zinc finger protein-domain-containing protein [Apiospora arundinis]|uniref:Zinc finger protein-domain-containing protein n=1 Tax=Apiospora arundinis TaxID=335852 RepID=A0ABR2II42_9PEZI
MCKPAHSKPLAALLRLLRKCLGQFSRRTLGGISIDGGPGRSLLNDFQIHQSILYALPGCPQELTTVIVPKCYAFIPNDYPGWQDGKVLVRFPPGYAACNTLITERIPPMSESVRHRIIKKLCPQTATSLPEQIKADNKNYDCLVRPSLGRGKHGRGRSRLSFFSLRNYPLHLDQMEELGLRPQNYSSAMAKALAFLYWVAKIDANDIEFVLAPPSHNSTDRARFMSDFLGSYSLWILDSDCCRPMSLDDAGVERAARAFLRNDPFYPRPGRTKMEGSGNSSEPCS